MLHTRSINILTCISTRFDTQGFVDISPVVDHVLKFNPYVSGLFCTCGVVVIQCVLDISRYLFLINSHKMSRGSPIRTRYGVSLWIHSSCFLFLLFVLCATSGNIRPRYNEVSMVILLPPDHGDHPWVWDMVTSGQLFTVRGASCRGASWGLEAARWMLCWSYRSEVWQAFRQHFRGASQVSEWLKKSKPQSRRFEASRGPGVGRRSSAFSEWRVQGRIRPAALSTMLCPLIARITVYTPSETTPEEKILPTENKLALI